MRVVECLVKALRDAAAHNPDVQVAPACILWPDGDRQWEPVVPRLQGEMPELFRLGDFDPGKRQGPAIWLRCVIARLAGEDRTDQSDQSDRSDLPPILYLPGVSRQDLRAIETCPERLKPLAELQYRGVIWSQVNAKDWTVLAFLKSNQGGLGLDVAQDKETRQAMQLALYAFLDEELDRIHGKHLDKEYFFTTVIPGGDPIRDLLQWLDQGEAFKAARDENAWRGFVEVCKSQLGFDPEQDGPLKGAECLAAHAGPWQAAWDRFCESPHRYVVVPTLISKTPMPRDLFADKTGWPKWNQNEEANLRHQLLQTAELPAHEARKQLLAAEQQHGPRRACVWAQLGEAPLAQAAERLAVLAQVTSQSLAAGQIKDLAAAYQAGAWQADAAAVAALAAVQKPDDVKAVQAAIRSAYLPWCDDAARYLQTRVTADGYPGMPEKRCQEPFAGNRPSGCFAQMVPDTFFPAEHASRCFLFVDGLRFDLAKSLEMMLREKGCPVESQAGWAALPSVTSTGKPAVSPVQNLITGQDANADFEPAVAATGQSLKGGYQLRKLLGEQGWQVLGRTECGDPTGKAWTEAGDIDQEGHDRGWQLTRHVDRILSDVRDRVLQLLEAGWKTVEIVTDHGWLLMPGGLPKTELPSALSENTWGRCAAIKPGAATEETTYPWYWNPDQQFALAPGISCYRAGLEYAHGGISLQECLLLSLTVATTAAKAGAGTIQIRDVVWQGMRCKVAMEGSLAGLRLDLRTHAGNPATSVVRAVRPFKADGLTSVVVDDEDLAGQEATIVILDNGGNMLAQAAARIGG